jgi:protein involved in ribonucleotide reduction
LSIDIIYFSNHTGNTHRFVEKFREVAGGNFTRIPLRPTDGSDTIYSGSEFVLFVPTYGGGSEKSAIPRQVRRFLNVPENRNRLRGVVGFGNTNFGDHFCKAAELISAKTGVPIIDRIEIFGAPGDIERLQKRLEGIYGE